MIIGAIVSALLASIDAIVGIMPALSLPVQAADSAVHFGAVLNHLMPVEQLALASIAIVGMRVGLSAFSLALFIYHQFWGSS